MNSSHVVEMNNVFFSYSKNSSVAPVLRGISFHVKRGEIFGMLGPSGAGKTTILKILTNQVCGIEGSAFTFGKSSESISTKDYEKIGILMEDSGSYERLRVYDNLLLFARIHDIKRDTIDELLNWVQLSDARDKRVSTLSKGMRQRLLLSKSLLHNPELVFLDEPTNGLDPTTAASIHKLFFDLKKEGTTLFVTTHNMEEASKLCDRIILLDNGRIVESGNPKEICNRHNDINTIRILCNDGKEINVPNSEESAKIVYTLLANNNVLSIHSSEPDLGAVFMKLTGKELECDH